MSDKTSWIHTNFENWKFAKGLRWSLPIVIIIASGVSLYLSRDREFDGVDFFTIYIIIASLVDLGFSAQDKIFDGKGKNEEQKKQDVATRNFIALLLLFILILVLVTLSVKYWM